MANISSMANFHDWFKNRRTAFNGPVAAHAFWKTILNVPFEDAIVKYTNLVTVSITRSICWDVFNYYFQRVPFWRVAYIYRKGKDTMPCSSKWRLKAAVLWLQLRGVLNRSLFTFYSSYMWRWMCIEYNVQRRFI